MSTAPLIAPIPVARSMAHNMPSPQKPPIPNTPYYPWPDTPYRTLRYPLTQQSANMDT